MTLERIKGWRGIFISVREGIWVGIRWRLHPKEDALQEVETVVVVTVGKLYAYKAP